MTKTAKVQNLLQTTTLSLAQICAKTGASPSLVRQVMRQIKINFVPLPQGTDTPEPTKLVARDHQEGGDHYLNMGIQPWDVVDTWPHEQRIGAYRFGALKYLMRMGSKDESQQEIAKGHHYMRKLLETLDGGRND